MNRPVKLALSGVALLLAGSIFAPLIRVDQYREQIRIGLERSLHRKVEIYGDAHINLFRGPGFSVGKVVIYDDPSAGLEPFANVPELQTTVSLQSLWTGRLSFAAVRFVDPSLNLVKPSDAPWNAIALLAGADTPLGQRLPEIRISGGRINFKFGDTKSAFYLTDTDLVVTPERDGVEIRFSCAPARTDRSQQGYGAFRGRGRITAGQIDFDAQLDKSPVEELVTLVRGQNLGLHGSIASRAKIQGPLSHPRFSGRFELEDVHRWDLNPGRAGVYSAAYRGNFDLATQRLEMQAEEPMKLHLLVSGALVKPEWLIEATLEKLPAANLIEFAKHMGAPVPPAMKADGRVDGSVRYGSATGMTGQIAVENAQFQLEGGPQFRLDLASLEITGDEIRLLPADLENARIEARYAPFRQNMEVQLMARSMRVGPRVYGIAVPLLDRFRGGTWTGTLHYLAEDGKAGQWKARVGLRDTTTVVPGLALPVRIATAEVDTDGERLIVNRLRAVAGKVEFFGDYRYDPEQTRPHQFNLTIPQADAEEVERILLPTLQRGGYGFLARTLRWRSPMPDWLKERRASGSLRIGMLSAGDLRFRGVRSRVVWTGGLVQLTGLEARLDEGALAAEVAMDLTRSAPQYELTGTLKNASWKTGHVDLDGSLSSEGAGLDVLANLKAEGQFQARSVVFAPETLRSASGTFDVNISRNGPQIRFASLQAALGTERFNGEGATQPDGRLLVDLASTTRMLRVSGPIASPRLAIMELPAYGPGQRHTDAR
ncbi:MAG: hypothetical protein H7039_18105 [Bryobacteraceae bacterium]|nr:hypothetical protein [Bryobacteraceae bacterium]